MKSVSITIFILGLLFCLSATALADEVYNFHDFWTGSVSVATNTGNPQVWKKFDFPDGDRRDSSTYSPSRFEFNDYLIDTTEYNSNIDKFQITVWGTGDYWVDPIDMFLDFNRDHASYYGKIASYDVPTSNDFILVLDFVTRDLLYDNLADANPIADVGNLTIPLITDPSNPFVLDDKDAFWLGFGCHFVLERIDVDITVSRTYNEPPPEVPEPSTILLLGMPLISLVAWRLRKR